MRRVISVLTVFVLAAAAVAAAAANQAAAPAPARLTMVAAGPITTSIKAGHDEVKDFIMRSAQMVTDKEYEFRPQGVAQDVRNYGQILGHIANVNYAYCGVAMGVESAAERGPKGEDFEKVTSKVEMQKVLAASFALLRQGVQPGQRSQWRRAGEGVWQRHDAARRAVGEQLAHVRALRQSRHVPPRDGQSAAVESAGRSNVTGRPRRRVDDRHPAWRLCVLAACQSTPQPPPGHEPGRDGLRQAQPVPAGRGTCCWRVTVRTRRGACRPTRRSRASCARTTSRPISRPR